MVQGAEVAEALTRRGAAANVRDLSNELISQGRDVPELSVVMPALDAADTIGDQIAALRHQSWDGAWELLVVDNGSTDATVETVDVAADGDRRIRVIDGRARPGPAAARNLGVREAAGTTIAFCDADDQVGEDWLGSVSAALRESGLVTGPLALDRLNPAWNRDAHGQEMATGLQSFAGIFPFGATANLGVRRDVFDHLGGFDESITVGEDIEFCLRAWLAGYELVFVPDAVVHYRLRTTVAALWHQSVSYGAATPSIARRLRDARRPTPPRVRGAKNVIWLARKLPTLRTRRGRARWVVVAGGLVGRVRGSVTHRYVQV